MFGGATWVLSLCRFVSSEETVIIYINLHLKMLISKVVNLKYS